MLNTVSTLRDFIRKLVATPLRKAVTTVLLTLFSSFVITRLIVARITDGITGPASYTVWVVGDFENTRKHRSIRDGFRPRESLKAKIDGRAVTVEERADTGDPKAIRDIAMRLAERRDTLLVVGHMRSTATKEALAVYLNQVPPIPVILTTETNPDLAPPHRPGDPNYPLVRLSATDRAQARDAVVFALAKGKRSFWVVEDTFNPVYSHYLAVEFIRNVQQAHREGNGQVSVWSTNLTPPSVETIRKTEVDCVLFAGLWSNALITIRQMKAIGGPANSRPIFVLSDASAEQDLILRRSKDSAEEAVVREEVGEDVYVMQPANAKQFEPQGHGLYGKDARLMVETLVSKAAAEFDAYRRGHHPLDHVFKRVLDIHRVYDARQVLHHVIDRDLFRMDAVEGGEKDTRLDLGYTYPSSDEYSISNTKFRVWQVKGKRFEDAKAP